MANFFKTTWEPDMKIESNRQIAQILDTDEDKIIRQYRKYLAYINKVKRNIVQQSESIVRQTRSRYMRNLQVR